MVMNGQLVRTGERYQLRFVRHLAHPPDKVWRALTEAEHLEAWFPTTIEGERRAGAALRFAFRDNDAPPIEGTMLSYDPPRLLELRWGNDETLRFELAPEADGTRTLLTFSTTFAELGKAARDAAGWHVCLDALAANLDGRTLDGQPRERWNAVHQSYVDQLGPEAATIGPPSGA